MRGDLANHPYILETGGFDADRHAILEMAMVEVGFEEDRLVPTARWEQAVAPYPGSIMDPAALKVNLPKLLPGGVVIVNKRPRPEAASTIAGWPLAYSATT